MIPGVEYAVPFAARLAERGTGVPGAGLGAAQILRDNWLCALLLGSQASPTRGHSRSTVPTPFAASWPSKAAPWCSSQPIGRLRSARRFSSTRRRSTRPGPSASCRTRASWRRSAGSRCGCSLSTTWWVTILVWKWWSGTAYRRRQCHPAKTVYPGPRPIELGHTVPADLPPAADCVAAGGNRASARRSGLRYRVRALRVDCQRRHRGPGGARRRMPGDAIMELIHKGW